MRNEHPVASGTAEFSLDCWGAANGQASERTMSAAAKDARRISTQVSHISAEYREHRQAPTLSVATKSHPKRTPHPSQSFASPAQRGSDDLLRRAVKAYRSLPKVHQRHERQNNLSGFVLEPGVGKVQVRCQGKLTGPG